MKFPVRLYRKRSWAVIVLATLTGCFAMHSGSGETLLPETGPPSSPPPADSVAVRDKTAGARARRLSHGHQRRALPGVLLNGISGLE